LRYLGRFFGHFRLFPGSVRRWLSLDGNIHRFNQAELKESQ
jgi:hypothetical protein